jgi:hypothetical protein
VNSKVGWCFVVDASLTSEGRLRKIIAWLSTDRRAIWILPAAVFFLVALLSTLGISGTSTPLLSNSTQQQGVIIGTPRAVRSDEWLLRTPLLVGQIERGFPRFAEVGVGEHDMSVLSDLPVFDWPELFHPQQIGYFLLPVTNGHAFEWWTTSALLILGAYALLLVLLRDWRWAAVGALVLWASPFFHWWYYPEMPGTASWAMLAVAALLSSFSKKQSGWHRWWRVAAAAYCGVCFAFILYPPGQIPVIFVSAALSLGWISSRLRSNEVQWRRVLVNSAVAIGFVAALVVLFAISRRSALQAISGSVYPGDRRVSGGGASAALMFDSWFGWNFISNDVGMRSAHINESEASSFFFFGIFMLPSLALIWGSLNGALDRLRGAMVGLIAAIGVLLVHMYIGWGGVISRITLLDRVSVGRALLGLGLASALLFVVAARLIDSSDFSKRQRTAATVILATIGTAGILWFGFSRRFTGLPISRLSIVVAVVLFLLPALLLFWRPFLSLIAVAIIGAVLSLPVNPLVRGLYPVDSSTLIRDVQKLDTSQPNHGWLTNDRALASLLAAAGVNSVSSVNLYPNTDAWRVLDPMGKSEFVWNRFAHVQWVFEDGLADPTFFLLQSDFVELHIDPCDQRLRKLDVSFVASPLVLTAVCLTLESDTVLPSGSAVFLYSVGKASP